ncbi:MAG: hypothetical protein K2M31_09515 [Muribaculaceae bacterium]|nr:hypothetical protein [Muribaculaceae bacterium]
MAPATKKILKWSILILLLAYVAGITVWARFEADRHIIRGITISMENGKGLSDTITTRGIKASLMKYPQKIVGVPANTVNTLDIERYLMKINNFEDVKCYVSSAGELKVTICPMIPEMRVFDGNQSYYVNKAGKRINSNAEFYADVPIVSGHFTKNFRPESILPVIRFVNSDEKLKEIVGMFEARGPRDIILIPRIAGHVINFGDTTRLKEKRAALLTAYHKIIPYKGWEEYDTISVKFRGQIVATRRNKAPRFPIEVYEEEIDPEEQALPNDSVREVQQPLTPEQKAARKAAAEKPKTAQGASTSNPT